MLFQTLILCRKLLIHPYFKCWKPKIVGHHLSSEIKLMARSQEEDQARVLRKIDGLPRNVPVLSPGNNHLCFKTLAKKITIELLDLCSNLRSTCSKKNISYLMKSSRCIHSARSTALRATSRYPHPGTLTFKTLVTQQSLLRLW